MDMKEKPGATILVTTAGSKKMRSMHKQMIMASLRVRVLW